VDLMELGNGVGTCEWVWSERGPATTGKEKGILNEPQTIVADDVWQFGAAREYGPECVLGTDE
jgi:hypothetical protein